MHRAPIDINSVRADLATPWRQVDIVDETGSTNADLLARATAGENIDGAVLLAEYQSQGRGRHGRNWSTPARSQIAMSVGVGVDGVPPDAWGWLPLLTGLAVVDAVREATGIEAGLKWPNDVLVGANKLAGILAEVASPQPVVIIGLGLNVTLTAEEAPDLAATSLAMLGSPATDRAVVLAAVLTNLGEYIASWRTARGPDADLVDAYRRHSLTLGTRVRASLPGDRQLTGTAVDIDGLGRLRIDTGHDIVLVSAGDITHLRPETTT